MRISDINKDVRFLGTVLQLFSTPSSEAAIKKLALISSKVMERFDISSLNGRKTFITRRDGSKMRVCIFNGKKSSNKTVGVLWLHGGGYAVGSPEMAKMTMAKHLVHNEDCVIVSPDYTLSAFAPYPAALMDCVTALQWMKKNREKLGINFDSFVVGGESAGGGLAAATAMFARDKKVADICLQIPLYPMIDDRDTETSAHNTAPVWNTALNHAAWKMYLGDDYGTDRTVKYAAPARAEDLTGMPPAVSVVGTAEPFYAETLQYFEKLERCHIPAKLMKADGCFHAFDMMAPNAPISKKAVRFVLDAYEEFISDRLTGIDPWQTVRSSLGAASSEADFDRDQPILSGDGTDKSKAYTELQQLRQEGVKYNITDFDKEREAALKDKYGAVE